MAGEESDVITVLSEKFAQQPEISDLQLQLNAAQQAVASLQLMVKQKEEIIIKNKAENCKQIEALTGEIKKLKDQLKETTKIIESSSTSELQQALKSAKEKGSKAMNDLQDAIQREQKMNQMLEEYEKSIASQTAEFKNLNELHETVKGNLSTLETGFHDVIQKYERLKGIVEGFKTNEEIMRENTEVMEKNLKMEVQRYESLKVHATKVIEKANKENILLKSQFETLELKQNAIIKRLEIKISSLENSLEQKVKECAELAALCDEVTGKRV